MGCRVHGGCWGGAPEAADVRVLSADSILSSDRTENYLFDTWPVAEALMTAVTTVVGWQHLLEPALFL